MNYHHDKPNNYMALAIISTILCCMPLGIVSIINAAKVNELYYAGKYDEAITASKNAKKWAMWSIIPMAIFWVLYIIVMFGLIIFGAIDG